MMDLFFLFALSLCALLDDKKVRVFTKLCPGAREYYYETHSRAQEARSSSSKTQTKKTQRYCYYCRPRALFVREKRPRRL